MGAVDHSRAHDDRSELAGLGPANPGEVYIKNFGTEGRPVDRVLVCGVAGQLRRPVTIFPRERFAQREIHKILWP
jgi:hypothetical protein